MDLSGLGIEGRDVLVHASLSSLGHVEGGAEAVVEAFVGMARNVLFPTHTWAMTIHPGVLRFDVRETPSMQVGAIPEAARRRPGGTRSLHATHSVVAFGPDADSLVEGHHLASTPCGPGTAYWRLADRGGLIVLLGVNQDRNTCIHGVEEHLDLPGAIDPEPREALLIDADGIGHTVMSVMHSFLPRNFNRFDGAFSLRGIQRVVRLRDAAVRIVDARAMRSHLIEVCRVDPIALTRPEPAE